MEVSILLSSPFFLKNILYLLNRIRKSFHHGFKQTREINPIICIRREKGKKLSNLFPSVSFKNLSSYFLLKFEWLLSQGWASQAIFRVESSPSHFKILSSRVKSSHRCFRVESSRVKLFFRFFRLCLFLQNILTISSHNTL
jgi:hypothetical protein